MRLLIPHLQRAATINRMLDLAASAKATLEATINSLSVPVLLTNDVMRIMHVNPAARQKLNEGKLIREIGGVLSAASKPITRALEVAVERASHDIGALGRKGLGIPLSGSLAERGVLHVLPLREGVHSTAATVAIFVAHTGTSFTPPTELVAALFGLTPAESRVFDRIAAGQTMAEAAEALGVEPSTIKTHLRRVYEKTGTTRRRELQQVATSLTLPIASYEA